MALEQEPLADAIARADQTVRFTATAGEENGPYAIDRYVLVKGDGRHRARRMTVDGTTITVLFPLMVEDGDEVQTP